MPVDAMRFIALAPHCMTASNDSKRFAKGTRKGFAIASHAASAPTRCGRPQHGWRHSGDAVRVFERAVVHPGVKFEIVFGVSDSNWLLYDVDHGRRVIGYEPQDFADVPEQERE